MCDSYIWKVQSDCVWRVDPKGQLVDGECCERGFSDSPDKRWW